MLVIAAAPPAGADGGEPIPIASIYAHSGPVEPAHRSSIRGVRLAVKEINTAGGVLGRPLKLLELDNRSTPIGSKVAADKAVGQQVAAIIGPAFSSHALAVARVAQAARVPMISSIATHPEVTAVGNYIFRVCFNDLRQGDAMGRFARRRLNARWVVMAVNLDSDYSIGLSEAFKAAFTREGGKVLASLAYHPSQTGFDDLVTRILSHDPDVLFVPGHNESARIVQLATDRGLRATPLGGDGWDQDAFFRMGGDKIKHGYFTTHWHKAIETERSGQFVDRYGNGEITTTASALAYDAVYLLADAIRRAGAITPLAVRNALTATRDFVGVTGTIAFNANGDPDKRVVMMEIRNGQPHYLRQVSFKNGAP